MAIQLADIRALFARSGNKCAFPKCEARLIEDDNLFVGQICHIEGASPGGPRFNEAQPQSMRDGVGNLLLLCYPHHRRIDTEAALYPVETLRRIKAEHEAHHAAVPFHIDAVLAEAILMEIQGYWRGVHAVQHTQSARFDMAANVNPDASFEEVAVELEGLIDNISELLAIAIGVPAADAKSGAMELTPFRGHLIV